MKVLEIVIEGRIRKIVKIDNMLFGFMAEENDRCYFHSSSATGEIPGKEERPVDGLC